MCVCVRFLRLCVLSSDAALTFGLIDVIIKSAQAVSAYYFQDSVDFPRLNLHNAT